MLDDIDLKILTLLQANGRMSHSAIGKEVDLTGPSVYARIQRLEESGVIAGYTVLINPDTVEQGLLAYIRIQTTVTEDLFEIFEEYVRDNPAILECHDMAGEDSYFLKTRVADTGHLQELIAEIRRYLPGSRTITSIAMLTVKEFNASGTVSKID